ncbi:MAG: serine aminopeptidase domain-containing protein [Mycoplasma sp.]
MLDDKYLNLQRRENPNKTIIFFHGILSDAYFAPPLEEIARELNFDYISYTFPLHKANKNKFSNKHFFSNGLTDLLKQIVSLVQTDEVILIGHSAGANWTARCYKLITDKKIAAMFLICPICSIAKIFTKNKIRLIKRYKKAGRKNEIKTSLKNYFLCEQIINNYGFYQRCQWIKLFWILKSKKFNYASEEIYKSVDIPFYVIASEIDMVIDPFHTEDLFKKINPNINFKIYDSWTHIPQMDNTESFKTTMHEYLLKFSDIKN